VARLDRDIATRTTTGRASFHQNASTSIGLVTAERFTSHNHNVTAVTAICEQATETRAGLQMEIAASAASASCIASLDNGMPTSESSTSADRDAHIATRAVLGISRCNANLTRVTNRGYTRGE
jgi:hypothetical protein